MGTQNNTNEIRETNELKKIIRIMNKYRLYTKIRKLNPYKQIMKKTKEHGTFPNTLNRKFKVEVPHTVFGTDITYVYFNYRRAYLSIIKDFCTGESVAYKVSQNLDMKIVLDTLEAFKQKVSSLDKTLIQSDQGFHYTNPAFIKIISDFKMIQSMSRKGACIDNAPTESFFGHFKDEVEYKQCKSFEELQSKISEYMIYYNTERKQWSKNKMTPVFYRDHLLKK